MKSVDITMPTRLTHITKMEGITKVIKDIKMNIMTINTMTRELLASNTMKVNDHVVEVKIQKKIQKHSVISP